MKKIGLLLLVLLMTSCRESQVQTQISVYDSEQYWYDNGRAVNEDWADVFYILPTCIHDWQDSLGHTHYHALPTDPDQRQRMLPSYALANRIFADSANFFAPYYRQISLESWTMGETVIEERFVTAMNDIREAFDHYMKYQNNGRPFVLAGFSQGGKCVVELVKDMDEATARQMAAAYVCGYKVTAQDTSVCKLLRPALRADDTGVTIVYNTVTDISGINPVLCEGNVMVANPASWTMDELPHAVNDSVSVRTDRAHHVLIAEGLDADELFIPQYETLFPKGCMHLLELTLYEDCLRKNVKARTAKVKR